MIDAHRHFWRYSPSTHGWIDESMAVLRRDFLPGERVLFADEDAGCGVVAVQALHSEDETRWLLESAAAMPGPSGVVGWVDLCAHDVDERLDRLAALGPLVGLRHLAQDEPDPDFFDRTDFRAGIARLAERQLCFDLLVREPQRPAALRLARDFPDQRFVLDHLGKPPIRDGRLSPWRDQLCAFAECDNVFAKLSGLCTEADLARWTPHDLAPFIDVALASFGPARLLFGSDWPVCLLAGTVERVVAAHVDPLRRLSRHEFAAITHGNAALIYGLVP